MYMFRTGDSVKALLSSPCGIVEGRVYTVTDINGGNIQLDNFPMFYTPCRFELIYEETPPKVSLKQERYVDNSGSDWIDEFSNTRSVEELRGAMIFTIGKYLRRVGKKDSIISEVKKIADYANRWLEYESKK